MVILPEIRLFRLEDQTAVRELVLAGLAEHWGEIDPHLNPDLADIGASYREAVFLIAREAGQIVGCGAVVRRDAVTGEVVRMSVARAVRRQGVGRQLLDALCTAARRAGMRRLVLETTEGWLEVRRFYESYGFTYTHSQPDEFGGQAHYELRL